MKSLYVDCPTGLAGDMLLAALLDLGAPFNVVEKSLKAILSEDLFRLSVNQGLSKGIRGLRVQVEENKNLVSNRSWKDIRKLIVDANFEDKLKNKIMAVFTLLAEAESCVHGIDIESVHFHEIGSIDSLVDIVGVCSLIDYLDPCKIFCSNPPSGSGNILTSHGYLPIPSPAVVEIAKRKKITLLGGDNFPKSELTTPTGLALMSVLADSFSQPSIMDINNSGIGLGNQELDRPNFIRIMDLRSSQIEHYDIESIQWENVISQEAWVDDMTSEDLSFFVEGLRRSGAIEAIYYSANFKKGREGFCIKAIVHKENANKLKQYWLSNSSTTGLRENLEGRWLLPRRNGFCETCFGRVQIKQTKRPNGKLTNKPEYEDLVRISKESGITIEEIRIEVLKNIEGFHSDNDWSYK